MYTKERERETNSRVLSLILIVQSSERVKIKTLLNVLGNRTGFFFMYLCWIENKILLTFVHKEKTVYNIYRHFDYCIIVYHKNRNVLEINTRPLKSNPNV